MKIPKTSFFTTVLLLLLFSSIAHAQLSHNILEYRDTNGNCVADIQVSVSANNGPFTLILSTNFAVVEERIIPSADIVTFEGISYLPGLKVECIDYSGCSEEFSISIFSCICDVFDPPVSVRNVECQNNPGTIRVQPTSGLFFVSVVWNDNNTTTYSRTDLAPGQYCGLFTITSALFGGNCEDIEYCYDVLPCSCNDYKPNPSITDSERDQSTGSISLNLSYGQEPISYIWNTGATTSTITGLSAGIYSVTITDSSCAIDPMVYEYTVNEICELWLRGQPTEINSPTTCDGNDGSIINRFSSSGIGVLGRYTGDLTYSWIDMTDDTELTGYADDDGFGVLDISAGDYKLIVTDENGCSDEKIYTVDNREYSDFRIEESVVRRSCDGSNTGSIYLEFYPNLRHSEYELYWSHLLDRIHVTGNTYEIDNLAAGTYTLEILSESNCTLTETFRILEATSNPGPFFDVHVAKDECSIKDGKASVTDLRGGNPPYTIYWDESGTTTFNDQVHSSLSNGQHSVTVIDDCNNSLTQDFIIEDCETWKVRGIVKNTTDGLANGEINVNTDFRCFESYDIIWNDGFRDINPRLNLHAGDYSCTVTGNNDCDKVLNFTVGNCNTFVEPTVIVTNYNCSGIISLDLLTNYSICEYELSESGSVVESGMVEATDGIM